jgi:hypothetical protein
MAMEPGINQYNRLATAKTAASNTVLASLGIAVPVGVNGKTHVRYWIPFTTGGAVSGAKFQLATPAGLTSFVLSFFVINDTTKAIDTAGVQVAAGTPIIVTGASTGTYIAQIEGDIVNGATLGNLDMQFAQNVSDVGVLTILAGSIVGVVLL